MKSISEIRRQLTGGEFEFSRHGLKRAVERNISDVEIQEAGKEATVIEDYPEKKMSKCHVCGAIESRKRIVSEMFELAGKRVLVEQIPARVCARCGEATFSRQTAERIRRIVHGQRKPVKKVEMEVLALS